MTHLNALHPSFGPGSPRCPSTPGRIRTCDNWFRKPVLYPLSYWGGNFREGGHSPGGHPSAYESAELLPIKPAAQRHTGISQGCHLRVYSIPHDILQGEISKSSLRKVNDYSPGSTSSDEYYGALSRFALQTADPHGTVGLRAGRSRVDNLCPECKTLPWDGCKTTGCSGASFERIFERPGRFYPAGIDCRKHWRGLSPRRPTGLDASSKWGQAPAR